MVTQKKRASVQLGSYSPPPHGGKMEITGLDEQEFERLKGAVAVGNWWVRVVDGRLEAVPAHLPLPGPTEDEKMQGFWSWPEGRKPAYQTVMSDEESFKGLCLPHIIVRYIGAGGRPPHVTWGTEAAKLERYGFDCLRSRRDPESGRYSEIWLLDTLFYAREELKEAIEGEKSTRDQLEAAVSFLCKHIHFGSLEASIQKAALVFD